jgi:hypothetical protein
LSRTKGFFAEPKRYPTLVVSSPILKRKIENEEHPNEPNKRQHGVTLPSLTIMSDEKPDLCAQPKLDCLIRTLSSTGLSSNRVASLLAITADFHSKKKPLAAVLLSRDDLYNQALSLCNEPKIRATILHNQEEMYVKSKSFFRGKKHCDSDEVIIKNDTSNTQSGFLNHFNCFFEEHLLQLEAFTLQHETYIDELFEFLTQQIKRHNIIPLAQATKLEQDLIQLKENTISSSAKMCL